jgi:acetylornithine deacetylase/succinyl-diaminopimelate desuccinylase-like protein
MSAPQDAVDPQAEVVDLCRDLLRIPSVNKGNGDGDERQAAEYVAEKLEEVGLPTTILESAPRRTSVITRLEGTDSSRPPLLIHGHLDVVPANAADWQYDPFSGEIVDDVLWGRGAVDMKDMDAMTLAVVRDMVRTGRKPPRDLVIALVADEEAGGALGARWLVENHPDHFADCSEAISEVGGFSYTTDSGQRFYLLETAQKGIAWMKLTVAGTAGHGSMINKDNAVTEICNAITRIGEHEFPIKLTKTVRRFLEDVSAVTGVPFDDDDPRATVARLGGLARLVGATLTNTLNPTQLDAGYKVNVIPGEATAHVDGRYLPGQEEEFERELDKLLGPKVSREYLHHDQALETDPEGPLWDAMCAAIIAEDPGAQVVPYMLSGGTDAKSFSRLGIRCFGYAPLQLSEELDFTGMFHGVDERVPLSGLRFGVRALDRFLMSS